MKVELRIDPACREPSVTITAPVLTDELRALAARLEGAGFPLPRRPFRPHVTLARRVAFPGPAPRGQDLLPRPLSVPCGRVSLLRSQLRPQGPLYTELAARG